MVCFSYDEAWEGTNSTVFAQNFSRFLTFCRITWLPLLVNPSLVRLVRTLI